MEEKQWLTSAFNELEQQSVHPSAEEIAAAEEGSGSEFALAEIHAHVGWCTPCQQLAAEFREFSAPAVATDTDTDTEWRAMQARLPVKMPVRRTAKREWIAAAVGFAACALIGVTLWMSRPTPSPVVVERRVEVPTPAAPIQIANAAVVDLFPVDSRVRGTSDPAVALPTPLPGVVTLIFHPAQAAQGSVEAVLLNAQGGSLWKGTLSRQSDGFTLALGAEILRSRPLTIELREPDGVAQRYLLK